MREILGSIALLLLEVVGSQNVLNDLINALESHVKNCRVGDPNLDVDMDPLRSKQHLN